MGGSLWLRFSVDLAPQVNAQSRNKKGSALALSQPRPTL